jgi:hypothetical protein
MNSEANPVYVILASVAAMLSALGAALMPAMEEVSVQARELLQELNLSVMDDERLRLVCLGGSIGGALLSVLLFPLPKTKPLIAKLFASGIAGMMFTPMVVRWMGLQRDTDTMLFASGVVALLGYSVLQMAVPLADRVAGKWLGSRFDISGYDVKESRPHARKEGTEE